MRIKNWTEADAVIRLVGERQIARDRMEGVMNERIAAVKAEYENHLKGVDAEIAAAEAALEAWCVKHRDEMTPAGKDPRSSGLVWRGVFGKVAWRITPPKLTLLKKVEKVLAALKAQRLEHCIRTVEEPNKEVLLALDDATLKTVHCQKKGGEQFEVKPDYAQIEQQQAADLKRIKQEARR